MMRGRYDDIRPPETAEEVYEMEKLEYQECQHPVTAEETADPHRKIKLDIFSILNASQVPMSGRAICMEYEFDNGEPLLPANHGFKNLTEMLAAFTDKIKAHRLDSGAFTYSAVTSMRSEHIRELVQNQMTEQERDHRRSRSSSFGRRRRGESYGHAFRFQSLRPLALDSLWDGYSDSDSDHPKATLEDWAASLRPRTSVPLCNISLSAPLSSPVTTPPVTTMTATEVPSVPQRRVRFSFDTDEKKVVEEEDVYRPPTMAKSKMGFSSAVVAQLRANGKIIDDRKKIPADPYRSFTLLNAEGEPTADGCRRMRVEGLQALYTARNEVPLVGSNVSEKDLSVAMMKGNPTKWKMEEEVGGAIWVVTTAPPPPPTEGAVAATLAAPEPVKTSLITIQAPVQAPIQAAPQAPAPDQAAVPSNLAIVNSSAVSVRRPEVRVFAFRQGTSIGGQTPTRVSAEGRRLALGSLNIALSHNARVQRKLDAKKEILLASYANSESSSPPTPRKTRTPPELQDSDDTSESELEEEPIPKLATAMAAVQLTNAEDKPEADEVEAMAGGSYSREEIVAQNTGVNGVLPCEFMERLARNQLLRHQFVPQKQPSFYYNHRPQNPRKPQESQDPTPKQLAIAESMSGFGQIPWNTKAVRIPQQNTSTAASTSSVSQQAPSVSAPAPVFTPAPAAPPAAPVFTPAPVTAPTPPAVIPAPFMKAFGSPSATPKQSVSSVEDEPVIMATGNSMIAQTMTSFMSFAKPAAPTEGASSSAVSSIASSRSISSAGFSSDSSSSGRDAGVVVSGPTRRRGVADAPHQGEVPPVTKTPSGHYVVDGRGRQPYWVPSKEGDERLSPGDTLRTRISYAQRERKAVVVEAPTPRGHQASAAPVVAAPSVPVHAPNGNPPKDEMNFDDIVKARGEVLKAAKFKREIDWAKNNGIDLDIFKGAQWLVNTLTYSEDHAVSLEEAISNDLLGLIKINDAFQIQTKANGEEIVMLRKNVNVEDLIYPGSPNDVAPQSTELWRSALPDHPDIDALANPACMTFPIVSSGSVSHYVCSIMAAYLPNYLILSYHETPTSLLTRVQRISEEIADQYAPRGDDYLLAKPQIGQFAVAVTDDRSMYCRVLLVGQSETGEWEGACLDMNAVVSTPPSQLYRLIPEFNLNKQKGTMFLTQLHGLDLLSDPAMDFIRIIQGDENEQKADYSAVVHNIEGRLYSDVAVFTDPGPSGKLRVEWLSDVLIDRFGVNKSKNTVAKTDIQKAVSHSFSAGFHDYDEMEREETVQEQNHDITSGGAIDVEVEPPLPSLSAPVLHESPSDAAALAPYLSPAPVYDLAAGDAPINVEMDDGGAMRLINMEKIISMVHALSQLQGPEVDFVRNQLVMHIHGLLATYAHCCKVTGIQDHWDVDELAVQAAALHDL